MKNPKRKSIQDRILRSIILFALALVIAVSVPVCYGCLIVRNRSYSADAFEFARVVAHSMDGDSAARYAATGEKDGYYGQIHDFLHAICTDTEVTDCSVFVPLGEELVYVWDTGDDGIMTGLGKREPYTGVYRIAGEAAYRNEMKDTIRIPSGQHGQVIMAYSPVLDHAGQPAAFVVIRMLFPGVWHIIAQFLAVILLVTAAAAAVMTGISYLLLKKNIIRPLGILTESAERMVGNLAGNEPARIEIHTDDEMETLADAFTEMDAGLREYIRRLSAVTAEKEKIDTELNLAARIQEGMLPRMVPPFSGNPAYGLSASISPAKEVGGDFYDFFMADDRHLALVIADISGKGIPAALFTLVSKILIRESVESGLGPADALSRVNEKLLESNDSGLFLTVWLAVIDLETGAGVSANAGHEHPALRHGNGEYELVRYRHSPPVATMEDLRFTEREFRLDPGDTVFVYTDGVTEATDSRKELFGEERLLDALNRHRDDPPEKLLPEIRADVDAFVGDAPQFDDITMMAFRFSGKA